MPPIAVIDSNVLYSRKKREVLIEAIRQGYLDGVWSPHVIGELYRILTVRWFQKYGGEKESLEKLSRASKILMEYLAATLRIVESGSHEDEDLPDPDDFHLIRAARLSGASFVVSENITDFPKRNHDGLHVYDGVEYLTYGAFLLRLGIDENIE